jgi:hypothetical protein
MYAPEEGGRSGLVVSIPWAIARFPDAIKPTPMNNAMMAHLVGFRFMSVPPSEF